MNRTDFEDTVQAFKSALPNEDLQDHTEAIASLVSARLQHEQHLVNSRVVLSIPELTYKAAANMGLNGLFGGNDEEEDLDLVPVAVSALEGGGGEEWAMDVLKKLHRLNVEARREVAGSVATLLSHTNPRVQKLALDVVKELGIEFPLSTIVDLLDSPELGDEALKVLREATGRDFGRDREEWLKAIEAMEETR